MRYISQQSAWIPCDSLGRGTGGEPDAPDVHCTSVKALVLNLEAR
jgi:hypothetical protein